MTGSPTPSATARTNASCSLGRQPLEVGAQDDRPQVGLERLAGLEAGRFVRQPALDVDEAGRVQARGRVERRLEVDGPEPAVADRRRAPAGSLAMLPTPPHWATSQPPGRRTAARLREQRVVVRDPVERRGRQDRVHRLVERERLARGPRRGTRPGRRSGRAARARARPSPPSRRGRRRGRRGRRSASALGHAAGPAAGVQDALVAGRAAGAPGRSSPQRVIGSATRS